MLVDKLFIWGAGVIGERFLKHIDSNMVVAFIDSDEAKQGKLINGKKVISFEEYLCDYLGCFIIIAAYYHLGVEKKLRESGIYTYFWCMDCPGEWMDDCKRTEFNRYVNRIIGGIDSNVVVYGCNYYSFYIANCIYDVTGFIPTMAYNESYDIRVIEAYKSSIPKANIVRLSEVSNYEKVIITEDRRIGFDKEHITGNAEVIELWDCAHDITEYHNRVIKRYRDKYKNKRCFVVGLGPSLTIKDLDVLHRNNEICFSMNEVFYAFERTEWRPDFYVCSDTEGIKQNEEYYVDLELKKLFLSDQLGEEFDSRWKKNLGDRYIRYHIHRSLSDILLPRFSEDLSEFAYYGSTVTYIILQLAVYMGFKEIYLLGIDATGSSTAARDSKMPYSHFYNEEVQNSYTFEPYNTFAYMSAKEYADEHGIKILNATRGGELEVYDRVCFDSLF